MWKTGLKFNHEKFHGASDDEKANLLREKRLDAQAAIKQARDNAVEHDEQQLSRTHESLKLLGAGQGYGG